MKIPFKLVPLIVVAILWSSCSPKIFDPALLQPTAERVSPKLPRLTLEKNASEISYAYGNRISANSKMYTLFERELTNICETSGEIKGYIDPVITLNEENLDFTLLIPSILTLYTINLLGFPLARQIKQLEVEFIIKDMEENIVWNKVYYKKHTDTYGFYDKVKRSDELTMIVFREMIGEFKRDIQIDYNEVSQEL